MKHLGWIVAAVLGIALLVSIGSQNPKPAPSKAEPEPPWVAYQRAEAARDALANVRMSDSTQSPGYSDVQAQADADWARSQQARQTKALEDQAHAQEQQAEALRRQARALEEQRH